MSESSPVVSGATSRKPIAEWVVSGGFVAVEILSYVAAPGYFAPALGNPVFAFIAAATLLWQLIGVAYLCLPKSPLHSWPGILRWTFVLLIFWLQFPLVMMFGPAVITIMNALGPVMTK